MKTLILIILAFSSCAFADGFQDNANRFYQQQVIQQMQQSNQTQQQILQQQQMQNQNRPNFYIQPVQPRSALDYYQQYRR